MQRALTAAQIDPGHTEDLRLRAGSIEDELTRRCVVLVAQGAEIEEIRLETINIARGHAGDTRWSKRCNRLGICQHARIGQPTHALVDHRVVESGGAGDETDGAGIGEDRVDDQLSLIRAEQASAGIQQRRAREIQDTGSNRRQAGGGVDKCRGTDRHRKPLEKACVGERAADDRAALHGHRPGIDPGRLKNVERTGIGHHDHSILDKGIGQGERPAAGFHQSSVAIEQPRRNRARADDRPLVGDRAARDKATGQRHGAVGIIPIRSDLERTRDTDTHDPRVDHKSRRIGGDIQNTIGHRHGAAASVDERTGNEPRAGDAGEVRQLRRTGERFKQSTVEGDLAIVHRELVGNR